MAAVPVVKPPSFGVSPKVVSDLANSMRSPAPVPVVPQPLPAADRSAVPAATTPAPVARVR